MNYFTTKSCKRQGCAKNCITSGHSGGLQQRRQNKDKNGGEKDEMLEESHPIHLIKINGLIKGQSFSI